MTSFSCCVYLLERKFFKLCFLFLLYSSVIKYFFRSWSFLNQCTFKTEAFFPASVNLWSGSMQVLQMHFPFKTQSWQNIILPTWWWRSLKSLLHSKHLFSSKPSNYLSSFTFLLIWETSIEEKYFLLQIRNE